MTITRPPGDPTTATDAAEVRAFAADRGDAGVRIDRVLLRRLADVRGASRARIQRWIDEGRVEIDGQRPAKASTRVPGGALVSVRLPASPPRSVPAGEAREIRVLHEDPEVLVVDKPAGIVVHPSYAHTGGTLLNALLWHGREASTGEPPRLVHRLDKQTSGVLLVARTLAAHRALTGAWRARETRKQYLAIVIGRPPRRRGEIRLKLDRDPLDRRRVVASATRGRDSVTRYAVVAASRGTRAGVSLVACELLTGRMHQVRVHLATVGCPIVGDGVYGRVALPVTADATLARAVRGCARQALHAWRLTVRHPAGTVLAVESPVPADMRALLDAAGIDVDGALLPLQRAWAHER